MWKLNVKEKCVSVEKNTQPTGDRPGRVRKGGLEPPRRETPDPKSGAATITPLAREASAKLRYFPETAK